MKNMKKKVVRKDKGATKIKSMKKKRSGRDHSAIKPMKKKRAKSGSYADPGADNEVFCSPMCHLSYCQTGEIPSCCCK